MSSGSSPTTYIPEPAAPTITRSVTPQRDYQYAADVMDQLEAERKAIEEKTLSELTARSSELGSKEDKSYRESLPTAEPDYTEGLDPYQLNTIASQVYGGGAAAALQDLTNRRSREYTPVAGANPMKRPPTQTGPIPIVIPEIPANLFTPQVVTAPKPAPAPSRQLSSQQQYEKDLQSIPGMQMRVTETGDKRYTVRSPGGGSPASQEQTNAVARAKGSKMERDLVAQGKSPEYIANVKKNFGWMFR